jgi:hypothetical protein
MKPLGMMRDNCRRAIHRGWRDRAAEERESLSHSFSMKIPRHNPGFCRIFQSMVASTRNHTKQAAMLPTYEIRKLVSGGLLWQVVFKFENGHVEQWVGFNSEVEARNWGEKKLLKIASNKKLAAAA